MITKAFKALLNVVLAATFALVGVLALIIALVLGSVLVFYGIWTETRREN